MATGRVEVAGIRPSGNFLFRINDALNADHVWTMSPSTMLNVRGSWFQEPSIRQHQGHFDPANLGFPASVTQHFGDNRYFPRFNIGNYSALGDTFAGGTDVVAGYVRHLNQTDVHRLPHLFPHRRLAAPRARILAAGSAVPPAVPGAHPPNHALVSPSAAAGFDYLAGN